MTFESTFTSRKKQNMNTPAPSMSFERWLVLERLLCRVVHPEERLDILEEQDVELNDFLTAQYAYLLAIHAGLVSGDSEKAEAYRKATARDEAPGSAEPAIAATQSVLPFGAGGPSGDFQAMLAAHAGTVRQSGDTLDVKDPRNEPTLPFQFDASNLPSVEQYAELCVELSLYPERADETKARYGLEGRRFEALERLFTKKFDLQPELRGRFQRAYAVAYRQRTGS